MTENSVIEEIKKGNYKALDDIYAQYRDEFITWITKNYGGHDEDIIEVYQESMISFYENIVQGKLQDLNSSIKTYLFSIGKNKYLSKKRQMNNDPINKGHLEIVETDEVEKELGTEKEKKLLQIEAAMEKIGEGCKGLLKFFYYDQLSMDDISKKLEYRNISTAKNQKYKCMQKLRKLIMNASN